MAMLKLNSVIKRKTPMTILFNLFCTFSLHLTITLVTNLVTGAILTLTLISIIVCQNQSTGEFQL